MPCIFLLGSLAGDRYEQVGTFKLSPEDINMLSEDLRNALIPFEQVKITGDLGEGKKPSLTPHCKHSDSI